MIAYKAPKFSAKKQVSSTPKEQLHEKLCKELCTQAGIDLEPMAAHRDEPHWHGTFRRIVAELVQSSSQSVPRGTIGTPVFVDAPSNFIVANMNRIESGMKRAIKRFKERA